MIAQCSLYFPLRLTVEAITVKKARRIVKRWHRHLPDVQGGLFAASVAIQSAVVGVAIAGNPPRVWQGTGRFVISRVATNEHKNACSKLYGAICRAAEALGYYEAWTYTLPEESGESLRGAGFEDMGLTGGGRTRSAVPPEEEGRASGSQTQVAACTRAERARRALAGHVRHDRRAQGEGRGEGGGMILWLRCLRCWRYFTKRAVDLICPDCARGGER